MARHRVLLYLTFALSIVFGILAFIAQVMFFYWTYWWFDWLMHFLAGFIGGMTILLVFYYMGLWRRSTDQMLLPAVSVLISLMFIGVLWEVAEYRMDITDAHEAVYFHDVRNDLMADAFGAILASIFGVRFLLKKGDVENTNG